MSKKADLISLLKSGGWLTSNHPSFLQWIGTIESDSLSEHSVLMGTVSESAEKPNFKAFSFFSSLLALGH